MPNMSNAEVVDLTGDDADVLVVGDAGDGKTNHVRDLAETIMVQTPAAKLVVEAFNKFGTIAALLRCQLLQNGAAYAISDRLGDAFTVAPLYADVPFGRAPITTEEELNRLPLQGFTNLIVKAVPAFDRPNTFAFVNKHYGVESSPVTDSMLAASYTIVDQLHPPQHDTMADVLRQAEVVEHALMFFTNCFCTLGLPQIEINYRLDILRNAVADVRPVADGVFAFLSLEEQRRIEQKGMFKAPTPAVDHAVAHFF